MSFSNFVARFRKSGLCRAYKGGLPWRIAMFVLIYDEQQNVLQPKNGVYTRSYDRCVDVKNYFRKRITAFDFLSTTKLLTMTIFRLSYKNHHFRHVCTAQKCTLTRAITIKKFVNRSVTAKYQLDQKHFFVDLLFFCLRPAAILPQLSFT